jgi:hypothetical protein
MVLCERHFVVSMEGWSIAHLCCRRPVFRRRKQRVNEPYAQAGCVYPERVTDIVPGAELKD